LRRTDALLALATLIIKLETSLPKFDLLLSDDASGRLATLLLREMADKVRKKQGKNGPVETYFLAAGIHDQAKRIEMTHDFLATKIKPDTKVLLATEYISSGDSIMRLVEALQSLTENFRVATISLESSPEVYTLRSKKPRSGQRDTFGTIIDKTYWGKSPSYAGLTLYKQEEHAGVHKKLSVPSPHPQAHLDMPDRIATARQDIHILVEEFSKLLN